MKQDEIMGGTAPTNAQSAGPTAQPGALVQPSGSGECSCKAGNQAEQKTSNGPRLVYALGELAVDFPSEARRDSFTQAMAPDTTLIKHLGANLHDAASLHWVLKLDGAPIYAIMPHGPFAHVTYQRLHEFLSDEAVERVSIPGYAGGKVTLSSGAVVPAIVPEVRGMCSWSTKALLDVLVQGDGKEALRDRIEDFLNRVYYDYRNLGATPQERALNYSATNVFQASGVIAQATKDGRFLESISIEKSPIARQGADCYDVKLRFFDPENLNRAKRAYRFTVDVSDVIPVTIGAVRSWSEV